MRVQQVGKRFRVAQAQTVQIKRQIRRTFRNPDVLQRLGRK